MIVEMDRSTKQSILSFLKTVYHGVPLKKLFKRCQNQLEMCERSEAGTDSVGVFVGKTATHTPCINGK